MKYHSYSLKRLIIFCRPHKGQKGNCTSAFNCMRQGALMFCTGSRYSSRDDFAAFSDKISKRFGVFIIYGQTCIGTETTYFTSMKHPLFPVETGFLFPGSKVCSHCIASMCYFLDRIYRINGIFFRLRRPKAFLSRRSCESCLIYFIIRNHCSDFTLLYL